jgi:hypothetical protein
MRSWITTALVLVLSGCVINNPPAAPPAPAPAAAPAAGPRSFSESRGVVTGTKQKIGFMYSINPDCSSIGYATIRVVTPPLHGATTFEQGSDFTTFAKDNQRYECNLKKSPGVLIYYQSEPGFVGKDTVVLNVLLASGNLQIYTYNITVE